MALKCAPYCKVSLSVAKPIMQVPIPGSALHRRIERRSAAGLTIASLPEICRKYSGAADDRTCRKIRVNGDIVTNQVLCA